MSIDRERQRLFEVATGDNLDSMNQAVRLACVVEHEFLHSGSAPSALPVHAKSLTERFHVSRSVRNEAIRILQSREVIRAKPGPNVLRPEALLRARGIDRDYRRTGSVAT